MKIFLISGLFLMLSVIACSSNDAVVVKTQNLQIQKEMDMAGIKARFKKAYAKLACMANPGVDPQMNVVPLKRPEEFLKRVQKYDPAQLSLAMEVLKKYGFYTIQDFFDTMRTLKMDPKYWDSVENAFLDSLQNCD